MEVSLGIQRIAKSKSDRDGLLIKAALRSLERSVENYRGMTGIRHPEYDAFMDWLNSDGKGSKEENIQKAPEAQISSSTAELSASHADTDANHTEVEA
ncbi:hypothetical protein B1757_02555 [Acidithiobacillus marinus]|uniref:Uncharacterized protein n=2 Tax=Acidithiobacillus marinus TaxID=187490 RepID=A0A2I1DPU2_9PROT|nr:hypothetical protein B1757_02555 [Acidithiobacillus marinus]